MQIYFADHVRLGDISTLDGTSLKLVDKFTYQGSKCLINRKRHQHAANEGMDSYQ